MAELRALLKLALPIVISQVGFVAMGFVDTLLVGPLGPSALSALSLGNTFFFGILIFGLGTIMALDTWISQAYGAEDLEGCSAGLVQGIWLAIGLWPILWLAMWATPYLLLKVGYDPKMVDLMEVYFEPLRWGILPAVLFKVYRCALASVDITWPLIVSALAANLANWGFNVWFIDGGMGLPAMGVQGVAWSTTLCRLVLFAPLFYAVHMSGLFKSYPIPSLKPSWPALKRLLSLGLPIGLQYGTEVGCFSGAAVLMGIKGEVPLAAHQVALNFSALLFMVPMGIGAAGAVRTGQAWGSGSFAGARRAGWTAIGCGVAFGLASACLLAFGREEIVSIYRVEADVYDLAVSFLLVAAIFQLGDAIQAITLGVLRGLGDTRVPFYIVLCGYGFAAAPVGLLGAFVWSEDPIYIWYGLATGLMVVAVALVGRFILLLRKGEAPEPVVPSRDGGPWSAPG